MPTPIRGKTAFQDLAGSQFSRLTVLPIREKRKGRPYWRCRCECGELIWARSDQLKSGNTQSCGCLNRDIRTTHNMWQTPEYKCWQQIKQRCHNPKHRFYPDYGARGIYVCDRWRKSFENFIADLGRRPKGTWLDRIDNDGPYIPENCAWRTPKQQGRNRRNNRLLTYQGRILPLSQWAEELGLSLHALRNRVRNGWSDERTLSTPVQIKKRR